MTKLTLTFGMAALACASMSAFASSPWDGTWKLNEAKSKMTGSTFSVSKDGDMYLLKASTVTFKYACDGKDYPVIADRTFSCTMSGMTMNSVSKGSGKTLSTTKRDISADGKTLTEVETGTRPDGTSFTDTETYLRAAGSGTSLVGTWKNTKVTQSAPDVMVLKLNGDVLHSENPGYKSTIDAKLDGTPAPIVGPTVPEGVMLSNKAEGNNKVISVETYKDKELSKDIMTLSADGKWITDVSWTPGKEAEKETFVYEKQ